MKIEFKTGTFYCGDCFDVMAGDVKYFDMCITSPPYDNMRSYNGKLDWSFDGFKKIAVLISSAIKDGGVIVWNVSDSTQKGSESGTSFRQALFFKDHCGLNIHDTMIWEKDGNGGLGSEKCYHQNFEYMFVLSKGSIATFNLIKDRENVVKSGLVSVNRSGADGSTGVYTRKERKPFGKRNNIWKIKPQRLSDHPAPFPVNLARDHIISWSNEGEVVLDPFAGSGTTAIAAIQSGRRWICIERDQGYFEKACERVAKAEEALI